MIKIIQFLYISFIVIIDNTKKVINTFKLIYILLKKDYKKASYNTKNKKINFKFEF